LVISKETLKAKLVPLGIWEDLAYRREIDLLCLSLLPRENPEAATSGVLKGRRWLVALTDRRILFLRKGLTAAGTEVREFPLDRIRSANGKRGILFGRIEVDIEGVKLELKNLPKGTVLPFLEALARHQS
jgi:hypothetical protein